MDGKVDKFANEGDKLANEGGKFARDGDADLEQIGIIRHFFTSADSFSQNTKPVRFPASQPIERALTMPFHSNPAYTGFTNDDIAYGLSGPRADFLM